MRVFVYDVYEQPPIELESPWGPSPPAGVHRPLALADCHIRAYEHPSSRRRPWARIALSAITAIGIVANLAHLLVPAQPIEPPPPEAPPDDARLLLFISIAAVVLPVVACLALAWVLWRLRSPAVRDQFR